jgi:uncharacterized membrane protein YhaH (DUF805 family)
MSFRDEVRVTRLISLQGRRARLSYLLAPLAVYAAVLVLLVGGAALGGIGAPIASMTLLVLGGAIAVAAVWVGIALGVQRLHDMSLSGWLILVGVGLGIVQAAAQESGPGILAVLAGIAGLGFALWLLLAKGTDGPNRFGPPPTWPA